jgi:hypothetical protein
MVNWQIEVDKVIKESREGIFNISCEPKTVSAAILRVNHWCPLPWPKQIQRNHFKQGSQVGTLVLEMDE